MKRKGYYTIIISDPTKNPPIDIKAPVVIKNVPYEKMYLWEADYLSSMCLNDSDFISKIMKTNYIKSEMTKPEYRSFNPTVINIKGTSKNKVIIYDDPTINYVTSIIINRRNAHDLIADKYNNNIQLTEKEQAYANKHIKNGKFQSFTTNDAKVEAGYARSLTQELCNYILANPANLEFINKCRASINPNYAHHLFDELTEYQTQYHYESRGGVPSEKGRSSKQIFVRCEENLRVYNNFREAHYLMKLVKQKDLEARKEDRTSEKKELEDILKYYNSLNEMNGSRNYDNDYSIPDEEYETGGYNI